METGFFKDHKREIILPGEDPARIKQENEKIGTRHLFLEALFNGIQEEILVIDHDFVIQDVNEIFLKRHDLTKTQVLGKKCHNIICHSDTLCEFDTQECLLEETKRTGKRAEVTYSTHQEDGKSRVLTRTIYPIRADGKVPKYFVEVSRDVTDYQNLARKFRASEKKFRAILNTATDAILSIDDDHRVVLFNDAAQRIFGYSRDEVLGKNLNMLIPPQQGDHYALVRTFLETKDPTVIGKALSIKALNREGEEFPIALGLSYHEMEGHITFTAIIRDVSEQKKLEKKLLQSERLAAVGEAVAHVAHEIKNPLMIIGGFSHHIKKSLVDAKAVQKVDMILDEVSRLEKLVENLGDFTKEYKLMKRPADINSVIQDVLKIMGEIYSSEKYEFKANLDSSLDEINCDPDKLKQVFMNVIVNGIEAMENGGTIAIDTEKWSNGIEIRISDEGIGISDNDLLHIFEPFFTTRERGSGLGLCISYKIVEAHKGEIWADSEPGEGTTFVIRLPSV